MLGKRRQPEENEDICFVRILVKRGSGCKIYTYEGFVLSQIDGELS